MSGPRPHSRWVSISWLTRACSIGISWASGPGAASIPASTFSICASSTRGRLSGADVLRLQRGLGGAVPVLGDALRRVALLAQDALGDPRGLRVARPRRDAHELLVATDLQVLERVGERGELAGRVRVQLEEHAPVEAAHAHGEVLDPRRPLAVRLQALLDARPVAARLL